MGLMLILDAPRACRGETHEHDEEDFYAIYLGVDNIPW